MAASVQSSQGESSLQSGSIFYYQINPVNQSKNQNKCVNCGPNQGYLVTIESNQIKSNHSITVWKIKIKSKILLSFHVTTFSPLLCIMKTDNYSVLTDIQEVCVLDLTRSYIDRSFLSRNILSEYSTFRWCRSLIVTRDSQWNVLGKTCTSTTLISNVWNMKTFKF